VDLWRFVNFLLHNAGSTLQNAEYTIEASKKGDFIVNSRYTFEVGGRSKSFKQIKDMQNAYIASDTIEVGFGNKIPLWIFGFLY
jgi:hypothetical protein